MQYKQKKHKGVYILKLSLSPSRLLNHYCIFNGFSLRVVYVKILLIIQVSIVNIIIGSPLWRGYFCNSAQVDPLQP